MRPTW